MHVPNIVYSPKYNTDLSLFGVVKPFALDRGQLVLEKLKDDFGEELTYVAPDLISNDFLPLVHSNSYLQSLLEEKTWKQIFELTDDEYFPDKAQLPLPELIDDIRLKCGGTLLAARLALKYGLAANLGAGYHHAFPDQGRGFCVLNDIAIAIRVLQQEDLVDKVLILDLDFHQGDGTALIFQNDLDVFTFSVHSQEGWPDEKQVSDLDIAIPSSDAHLYQQFVEDGVNKALSQFTPELVIFIAGSDPYELDVLPGTKFLRLSLDEMRKRDQYVLDTFSKKNIPLAMVFAGGYGPDVWEVHYNAVKHLLKCSGMLINTDKN